MEATHDLGHGAQQQTAANDATYDLHCGTATATATATSNATSTASQPKKSAAADVEATYDLSFSQPAAAHAEATYDLGHGTQQTAANDATYDLAFYENGSDSEEEV